MAQQPLSVVKSEPLTVAASEPLPGGSSRPASAHATDEGQWTRVGRLFAGAKNALNFPQMGIDLMEASKHPVEFLTGIAEAMQETRRQGAEIAAKGGVVNAAVGARKQVLSFVPLAGPWFESVADRVTKGPSSPEFWEATGEFLTAAGGPKAAETAIGIARRGVGPVFKPTQNPVARGAVEFAEREGVPLDAGTVTDSNIVKRSQQMAANNPGGAGIAEPFRREQAAALERVGRQQASRANAGGPAVTPEQAGQAVRSRVQTQVDRAGAEADQAYRQLRDIEAQPQNRDVIPGRTLAAEPAPLVEAQPWLGTGVEDIWHQVLSDARAQGYTGPISKLRQQYLERARSARDLRDTMTMADQEASSSAFLQRIRELGGIRPYSRDGWGNKLRGDFENLVQRFSGGGWRQKGGASIFRKDGLALDDLLTELQQDPIFGRLAGDEHELIAALEDIAAEGPREAPGRAMGEYLEQAGVRPGTRWWDESAAPAAASASAEPKTLQLAVDLTQAKPQLRPAHAELKREAELVPGSMMGGKARALVALDRLLSGPDQVSASTLDAALSDLKAFARKSKEQGRPRTSAEGIIIDAVGKLETALQQRLEQAGPEAQALLKRGRLWTRAKYAAQDVLEQLRTEPVQVFNQVTYKRDAGVVQLRRLAKVAPDEIQAVGRAYLDQLIDTAMEDGTFGHHAKVSSAWKNLGPETKRILFRDAEHVADLDRFFALVERIGHNPNPSGTALTLSATKIAGIPLNYALAKLAYTPGGVKLLTQGVRIPAKNASAVRVWRAQVARVLNEGARPTDARPAAPLQPAYAQDDQRETRIPQ